MHDRISGQIGYGMDVAYTSVGGTCCNGNACDPDALQIWQVADRILKTGPATSTEGFAKLQLKSQVHPLEALLSCINMVEECHISLYIILEA